MLEQPMWDEYLSSIYSRALSRTVAHCCRLWKPDILFGSPHEGGKTNVRESQKHTITTPTPVVPSEVHPPS